MCGTACKSIARQFAANMLTNHDKCKTVALRCTKERFISSVCDMWCGLLLKPCFLMPTIFFCKACCPTAEFLQQSFCTCIHSCRMRRGDAKRNYISKVRYHLPIGLVLVPLQHSTWQVNEEFDGIQHLDYCFLLMAIATEWSRFCRCNMVTRYLEQIACAIQT